MKFKRLTETMHNAESHNVGKLFDEMEIGEQFIYETNLYEFFGIKVNEETGAFLNADGKFFKMKKYVNCFTPGNGYVMEYNSLNELKEALK